MDNVKVLDALGSPVRVQIVEELRKNRALRVGDLSINLRVPQPTVSKHLKVMRDANLVTSESYGSERWYSLNNVTLGAVAYWMTTMVPVDSVKPIPEPRNVIRREIDYSRFEQGFALV
jgi:DNA-binding transcriptional ArsR family regulator